MPYSAGTAYLQVTPSFRGIERILSKEAGKIGQEVNKAVKDAIPDGIKQAAAQIEKEAHDAGKAFENGFSDAFSGAFQNRFHKQIEAAFKSIPKLDIEGLAGIHAEIEGVRQDLEDLHGQHIGIEIDERSAIAAFENMHERIRQLREELELDPNSDLSNIHNLRIADAQLEALRSTVDDARRYGHLAGDEYGGAWANSARSQLDSALKSVADFKVKPDMSDTQRALAAVRGEMLRLRDVKIGVDMDADKFLAEMKFLEGQLDELAGHTTETNLRFDIEKARDQVRAWVDQVMPEAGEQAAERFGGAFENALNSRLRAAAESLPEIQLKADSSPVDRAVVRIRAELDALSKVTVGVDMDATTVLERAAFLEEQIAKLRDRTVDIDVRFNLDKAHETLVKFRETVVPQEAEQIGETFAERFGGAFENSLQRSLASASEDLTEIQLKADSSGVDRSVARIKRDLKELAEVNIGVDMDAQSALVKIAFLEEQIETLRDRSTDIDVIFNLDKALGRLRQFRDSVVPKLGEETGDAYGGAFSDAIGRRLQNALKSLPNIEPDVNLQGAELAIAGIRREIEELSGKTVGIDIDEGQALARILALKEWLDELARTDPNIRVQVESAAAAAELLEILKLAKMVDDADPKVKVDSKDAKTAVEQLQEFADAAAFGGSRLGFLVATSLSLGTVVVPMAAAAAVAIGGIGTAAAGVAAGIGVAILGFSGVIGAVGALNKYQDDTAKSAASLATSQGRVSGALEAVQSAERALGNTRQQNAYQEKQAARAVIDAQRGVTDAERSRRQAVMDLQKAIDSARRAEQDRAMSIRDNALAQRQSNLDIAEAKRELDKILANPQSTADEREQARITYEQRLLQMDRLKVEGQRQQEDKAKADKAGIAGSDQVQAAQERLRSATENVAKAQQRVADAIESQAQQRVQSEQQVASGLQAVANAQRQVEQASTRAGVAGGAALDNLNTAMGKLTPTGQKFALFLFGLKDEFLDIRAAAEEGMLPGVQTALEMLMPYFPKIKSFVGDVATALGGMAVDFMTQMKDPVWRQFFGFLADSAVPALKGVFTFSMNVSRGLASLFMALTPFNKPMGGGLIDMSERFATWAAALERSSGYQKFLAYVERVGPKVVDLLGELGQLAVNFIIGAAPVGEVVLDVFEAIANGLNSLPAGTFTVLLGLFASLMAIVVPLQGVLKLYGIAVSSVHAAKLLATGSTGAWNKVLDIFRTTTVPDATQKTQQFGFAMQEVETKTGNTRKGVGGLGAFFGGPWGIAIGAAVTMLGLFGTNVEDQEAKVKELQSTLGSYAQTLKNGFTPSSTDAARQILAQNKELRGLVQTTKSLGISQETVVKGLNGDAAARKVVVDALNAQILAEVRAADEARHGGDANTGAAKQHSDRANALRVLGQAFDRTSGSNQEANELMAELNAEMANSPALVNNVREAFTNASAGVGVFHDAIRGASQLTNDQGTRLSTLTMLAGAVSGSHLDAAQKVGLFRDVLGELGNATKAEGPTFDALSGVFNAIATSALTASEKTSLLKQAMDQLYEAAISQNEAEENLVKTQLDLSTQLSTNSAGFDLDTAKKGINRDAILGNRDALEAALESTRASYIANLANGDSLEVARGKHEAQTKAIENQIPKAQWNSEAVQNLVKNYGSIPGSVETEFKPGNVKQVYDQLASLQIAQYALQNGLTPEEAQRKWELSHSKADQAFRTASGRWAMADGGRVEGWSPHKRADNIAAWLTANEFVHPVDTVDYYGVDAMEAIRQRLIPRELLNPKSAGMFMGEYLHDHGHMYADGGMVHPTFRGKPNVGPAQKSPLSMTIPIDILLSLIKIPTMQELRDRVLGGFDSTTWPPSPAAQRGDSGVWRSIVSLINSTGPMSGSFGNAYRPGDPLWHGSGRAVDWMGFNQDQLATFLAARRPLELIHRTNGHDYAYTRGRNMGSFDEQLMNEHRNHVHVAFGEGGLVEPKVFDQGGWLETGWNPPIWNGTGERELVLNPQQRSDMERAAYTPSTLNGGDTVNYNMQFADTTLDASKFAAIQDAQAAKARVGRPR